MTSELESAAQRYAVFACQVLQPAVYPATSALDVAAFQCADLAEDEFTCSLMVHDGGWRAAGVDREAEALNTPLMPRPL